VKCRENWNALKRICAQKRDGQPICDPNKVYSSRAIALGRMQHLAKIWSPAEGRWGEHVVDYNGDGVFDPHDPEDAVASTALHVRLSYEDARVMGYSDANAWRYAIRRYRGGFNQDYERRVYRAWIRWCAVKGYCVR
jgi:hypothetical protein